MNLKERQRIEYRPRLGIAVRVQAVIESVASESYKAPVEILESLEKTVTGTLAKGLSVLKKADDLLEELEGKLKDTEINGIAFQDYLKEKQNDGDYDIISAWEDANTYQVDGQIEGDVYPIVLDARETIVDNMNLLNDTFVKGDIYQDDFESLEAAEAKALENLVKNDIAQRDTATLQELKKQNEMMDVINGALDSVDGFLDDTQEVTNLTVDNLFRDNVSSVVSTLSEGTAANRDKLLKISKLGFAQLADNTGDIKQRTSRIKETNDIVHEEVKELLQLSKDAADIINWMDTFDTDFDESPITEVMNNSLMAITTILDGYDDVIGDMHKTNEMASMQYTDLVQNLYLKESQRQQYNVTNDISTKFDFSEANKEKQTERFVKSMGYK